MAPETFQSLLSGYHAGTLSASEQQELKALLHDPAYREVLENLFTADLEFRDLESAASPEILDMVYQQIKLEAIMEEETPVGIQPAIKKTAHIWRWTAAASIFITLAAGTYYFNHNPVGSRQDVDEEVFRKAAYIMPGGNKAVLTLSDGSNIELDARANGEIAKESGMTIKKTADGKLFYEGLASNQLNAGSKTLYNTIATPRGGQYQITLPDGTVVWLNAASSLKYPAVFGSKERKVELSGEAYFEVAKNKEKPFFVKTRQQEVEVLGTHFNVNAYNDEEQIKTTLLAGSVKVKLNTGKTALLKPGQQSQVTDALRVMPVEANLTTDWKDGVFWFNDENIVSIMRQFSRWYGIDVVCKGDLSNICFGGQVSRSKNLAQVLRLMSLTKTVQFKIEGKKVTVSPQPVNIAQTN